jgi:hypothetical protein
MSLAEYFSDETFLGARVAPGEDLGELVVVDETGHPEFVGAEAEPAPGPLPAVAVVPARLVAVARAVSRGAEDATTVEVTDDVGDSAGHR